MKRILILTISLVFMGCVFGQGKFTVPKVTVEQKLDRTYFQFWSFVAAGIDFAKAQESSPYDFGKYVGDFFAPTWDKESGFEGFVNGMLYDWEHSKTNDDGLLTLIEIDSSLVVINFPSEAWRKYLPEGNPYATFEEAMECMRGIFEQIANYLGCSITLNISADFISYTLSVNSNVLN